MSPLSPVPVLFVYYESLKRELKTKPINECWCDERLQTRVEECTVSPWHSIRTCEFFKKILECHNPVHLIFFLFLMLLAKMEKEKNV